MTFSFRIQIFSQNPVELMLEEKTIKSNSAEKPFRWWAISCSLNSSLVTQTVIRYKKREFVVGIFIKVTVHFTCLRGKIV